MNQDVKNYWKILETGEIFQNRKEAKDKLGISKFNIMLRTGEIIFINNNQKSFTSE